MSRPSILSETTPLLQEPSQHATDIFTALSQDPHQFGYAASEKEAQRLIERIRNDLNALKLDHPMIRGLIKKVAEDQYSHPLHFLFELLQNADDADYGNKHPLVNIRYNKEYLLFETNEIGFSDANVISICSATLSTKTLSDPTKEYIGEKGIGFKSVFMVARRVWIKSRYYSFRFDGHGEGARICPHWDQFPKDTPFSATKNFTAILIQLKESVTEEMLNKHLEKLDRTLLLFLRKVKDVCIYAPEPRSLFGTKTSPTRTRLQANEIPTTPGILHPTMVHHNVTAQSYLVYRHRVSRVPKHESRPGRTSAEIVLVLPESITPGQLPPTQKVFAFLPIRDYGLRFAIQSDFLLIANREGVPRNDWNKALLENVPDALLGVINQLNRGNYNIRYTWPLLLSIEMLLDEALPYNPIDTIIKLGRNNVLEDSNGKLARPRELTFVPERYRDGRGTPLIPPKWSTRRLISDKYPKEAISHLKLLGVSELSDEIFLEDLKKFIPGDRLGFQSQSSDWQSRVCTVLISLRYAPRSGIEDLDLIPLEDGRWVSAKSGLAYFHSDDLGDLSFPTSIKNKGRVHPNVEQNQKQSELFSIMNVPKGTKKKFCDDILTWHKIDRTGYKMPPARDLVYHLEFLYRANWQSSDADIACLWCAEARTFSYRTFEMYMPSHEKFSASYMAAKCNQGFHFLHPEYLNVFDKLNGGRKWLKNTLGIPTTIRIAKKKSPEKYEPHSDLKGLISKEPLEVLSMLRHHWSIYSRWFEASTKPSLRDSAEKMRDYMARIKVPCRHGTNKIRLQDTVLPRGSLYDLVDFSSFEPCDRPVRSCASCSNIISYIKRWSTSRRVSHGSLTPDSLLNVNNPDDPSWDFLEKFGVIVRLDYRPFKARLERMMQDNNIQHREAVNVYKQLQIYQNTLDNSALSFMKENRTIYVPEQVGASKGMWRKPNSCVWRGPDCLEYVPRLQVFYNDQFSLFHNVLGIGDADVDTFITEAKMLRPTDSKTRIEALIRSVSGALPEELSGSILEELRSLPLFPIMVAGANRGVLKLASRNDAETWFIPDFPSLRKAFDGKLNISVFESDFFMHHTSALYTALALNTLRLRFQDIQMSFRTTGKHLHREFTMSLRGKGPYIADLAVEDHRSHVEQMLKKVLVYQAERILATWTWEGDRRVSSREEEVQVATIQDKTHEFAIFIVDKDDMLESLRAPHELKEELLRIFDISPGIENDFLNKFLGETDKRFYQRIRVEYNRRTGKRARIEQGEEPPALIDEMVNTDILEPGSSAEPNYPNRFGVPVQTALTDHETPKESGNSPLSNQSSVQFEGHDLNASAKLSEPHKTALTEMDSPPSEGNDLGEQLSSDHQSSAHVKGNDIGVSNIVQKSADSTVANTSPTQDEGIVLVEPSLPNHGSSPQVAGKDLGVSSIIPKLKDTTVAAETRPPSEGEVVGGRLLSDHRSSTEAEHNELGPTVELSKTDDAALAKVAHSQSHSNESEESIVLSKPDSTTASEAAHRSGSNHLGISITLSGPDEAFNSEETRPRSESNEDISIALSKPDVTTATEEAPTQSESNEEISITPSKLPVGAVGALAEAVGPLSASNDSEVPILLPKLEDATLTELANRKLEDDELEEGITLSEPDDGVVTEVTRPRSALAEPFRDDRGRRPLSSGGRNPRPHSVGPNEETKQRNRARSVGQPILIPSSDSHSDLTTSTPELNTHPGFMSMSTGRIHTVNDFPSMAFIGRDTKDTRYFAELYVSQYLENFLGSDAFKPRVNWTSPMRSLNGHTPFPTPEEELKKPFATFTIPETRGKLSALVKGTRQIGNALLSDPCTYHIEVCETRSGLDSPFLLSKRHYLKAKELTIKGKKDAISDLFIIARVFNVHGDPSIALYADPWSLKRANLIKLESINDYQGAITSAAPSILTHKSVNESFASQSHDIYKGLAVGSGKIRLLKLTLNGEGEPLKGELVVREVNKTSFWAISYVWGGRPHDQSPLFETSKGTIRITNSLAECLTCLRRKGVTALLWADALCINQSDNVEKAMQVRRMGTLYENAQRVVIWMGNDTANDPPAIKTIRDNARRSKFLRVNNETGNKKPDYNNVDAFLQRTWFRRTWIIQELVLGSNVSILCGHSELGWEEMIQGIEACEEELNTHRKQLESKGPALALSNVRKMYKDGEKLGLVELLEIFYYTESSKPRDRLFALLHLAHDTHPGNVYSDNPGERHSGFNPDYDDLTDAGDNVILSRYAKEFVKKPKGVLDLLYLAGTDKSSHFCTWIPDFMRKTTPTLLANHRTPIATWKDGDQGTTKGFSAGQPFNPEVRVRDGELPHLPPVLTIKACVFDSIRDCRRLGAITEFATILEVVREYLSHVESYPNHPPDSDCRDQLLLKCLTGDAAGPQTASKQWYQAKQPGDDSKKAPRSWPYGYEKEILGVKANVNAHQFAKKLLPESHIVIAEFWGTVSAFLSRIPGATICTTKKGYVGIVPGATRPGDNVILVPSAKVPLVARKGERYYTLVGESYLHNLMYWASSGLGILEEEEVCFI